MERVNGPVLVLGLVSALGCAGRAPPVRIIEAPPPALAPVEPRPSGLTLVLSTNLSGELAPEDFRRGGLGALEGRVARVPEPKLVLDNGDAFFGSATSNVLDGRPVIEAYERMGVRVVNLGNHEFDLGRDFLRKLAGSAGFELLAGSVVAEPPIGPGWTVIERGGFRVGVIGLQSPDLGLQTRARHVEGLRFRKLKAAWSRSAEAARAAGAELLVVLVHEEPARVRLFMSRHSLSADLVVASDGQPGFQTRVGGVPLVQPGGRGRSVALARVVRDRGKARIDRVWLDAAPLDADATLHPALARDLAQAQARLDQVVGRTPRHLPVGDFHVSPLGHFVVDAWLEAVPQADVALLNPGALAKPLLEGQVTEGELRDALPYDDELVLVRLSGAQLAAGLEAAPIVGGFRWRYAQSRGGRKPSQLQHRDGWRIGPDRVVQVLMPEFMAEGGDGFPFGELPRRPTGVRFHEPVRHALAGFEASRGDLDEPRAEYLVPRRRQNILR